MSWLRTKPDFETAVRPELPVLYRVCRRFGASREDAEDIVQQTLVKAFQHWKTFDGRYLRSWLIRILRNEVLMSFRNRSRTVSIEEVAEASLADTSFWNEVLWNSDAEELLAAMNSLPEIHVALITLCDIEAMSYEEAAHALDIPIGTVRSRLFRARERLRQLVGFKMSHVNWVEQ